MFLLRSLQPVLSPPAKDIAAASSGGDQGAVSGQSGQEAEALAAEANISDEVEGKGWRQERRTFKECSIFHMDQWMDPG